MILLTKEINEKLKEAGLEKLTIIRNDDGYVEICGRKCHKPVMTFHTVKVGTKLTKDERQVLKDDYILPLINEYKDFLVEYIAVKSNTATGDNFKDFNDKLKNEDIFVKTQHVGYQTSNPYMLILTKKDGDNDDIHTLNYRLKDNVVVKKTFKSHIDIEDIEKFHKDMLQTVAYYDSLMKEYQRLDTERREHNKLIAEAKTKLVEVCNF